MINLRINGLNVSVEKGDTLLEAARFLGFPIPTLCH
ncbi:MAG TPA: 2Fe-2S iron-sulfur cluster-binding protein, partial [Thermodesulfobacteriota bacterium]|nr:2Fe-2S iron-sulfur cluster-binding protein [Thermodesulfobacteriota bacterium]